MTPIYLDNNATTPTHPEVIAAMTQVLRAGLGNPSSQHGAGRRARRVLEDARSEIGRWLGARTTGMDADQVIFTSGGTEANNLALRGLIRRPTDRILVSAIEHPSVTATAESLRIQRAAVSSIPVTKQGVVDLSALERQLRDAPTALVSVMLGNNETGILQPVSDVVRLCRHHGALIHTDAVQAVGKIAVDFRELGVDAMTVSAHKFHGPIGVGVLVVRAGVRVEPVLLGGFQQAGLRPGTESAGLAVGMARALQEWDSERGTRPLRLGKLRDDFELGLKRELPEIVVHGAEVDRLPHTSCIGFPGLDRQALLMAFDLAGVACSTGSACASGSSQRSPVLVAMGAPEPVLDGSLRFSFSVFNTANEVREAVHRISRIVKDLRQRTKSPN